MASKEELKVEFYKLIDHVPSTRHSELVNDFMVFNSNFEGYDVKLFNFFQKLSRKYFTKNLIEKLKKYVNDILDNYDEYSNEDKVEVQNFIVNMFEKYSEVNRTFLDRLLSVLRGS